MKYIKTQGGYVIRLMRGEELIAALVKFAEAKLNGNAAMVVGIGAVEDPVLGYYDVKTGKYVEKRYAGELELVSLLGSITTAEGKPVPHLHVGLSDKEMRMVGGHLFGARCAATVEMFVRDRGVAIERASETGTPLKLMQLPESLEL